jgi:hypothetical protein
LYRLAVVLIWASCISFLVCTVIAATLMSREFRHRSVSVDHSADIEVLSSAIAFVPDNYQDSKARRLAIVGRARNKATSRLQIVTFRVEVMNRNGKLVDVFSDSASGTFAANEQFGFELTNTMHTLDLPESEYVSHKLVVQQVQYVE